MVKQDDYFRYLIPQENDGGITKIVKSWIANGNFTSSELTKEVETNTRNIIKTQSDAQDVYSALKYLVDLGLVIPVSNSNNPKIYEPSEFFNPDIPYTEMIFNLAKKRQAPDVEIHKSRLDELLSHLEEPIIEKPIEQKAIAVRFNGSGDVVIGVYDPQIDNIVPINTTKYGEKIHVVISNSGNGEEISLKYHDQITSNSNAYSHTPLSKKELHFILKHADTTLKISSAIPYIV